MAKNEKENIQTIVHMKQHRKLKNKQNEPHQKLLWYRRKVLGLIPTSLPLLKVS